MKQRRLQRYYAAYKHIKTQTTCTYLSGGQIHVLAQQIQPNPLLVIVFLPVTLLARFHDLHQQIQILVAQGVGNGRLGDNLLKTEFHEALVWRDPNFIG